MAKVKNKYLKKIDIGLIEKTYALNFKAHFPEVIEFTRATWNLLNTFLTLISGIGGLTPKQKVSILTLGRTKRLEDESQRRAVRWLKRRSPKERWPWREILKSYRVILKNVYQNLSLYPHNHPFSVKNYVGFSDNKFYIKDGPLGGKDNNQKARIILGISEQPLVKDFLKDPARKMEVEKVLRIIN